MSTARTMRWAGALMAMLLLALVSVGLARRAITAAPAPPPEVQTQSFSVADGDPLTATGVHPADILTAGGFPAILCADLGLLCTDDTGANDDLNGLSFGWDFVRMGLPPLEFSVDAGSQGAAGTAVRAEAGCSPAEPQADAFETPLDGSNFQDLDGDGVACGSNSGFGLGLTEGTPSDNVDALERDPWLFVDFDQDGLPESPVFLTLAPGSPSLALIGATPADVLLAVGGTTPSVWAVGTADLGLDADDVIDAICVWENGTGVYDSGDKVLFSLAPGSPTLGALSASPADVLRPAPPQVVYAAAALGLAATDDVDALKCAFECYDLSGDRKVDAADLQPLVVRWRLTILDPDPDDDPNTPNYETDLELDGDGSIRARDVMLAAMQWGQLCP